MDRPDRLPVFLDAAMRAQAMAGRQNFLGRVVAALVGHGIAVEWRDDDSYGPRDRGAWSLHHMARPDDDRALVFRRAYIAPFWQIERSQARWDWATASAAYDPEAIDPAVARAFADHWRNRLYSSRNPPRSNDGFYLVPLQSLLNEHRGFQSMSPIAMLGRISGALPDTALRITLHPKAPPLPDERRALGRLLAAHPRMTLASEPTAALLPRCAGIITQNSAVAFHGFLLRKPALLFARIDFHHIAASVPRDGFDAALARFLGPPPDFDRYLWWFLQTRCINAGRTGCEDRIIAAFRACGMPL